MTQLYWVDEETADDPESNSHRLMSALEIGRTWPLLAPMIGGEGTESLTYVRELWRLKITPAEDSDAFDYEPVPVGPDYDSEPTFASRYITSFNESPAQDTAAYWRERHDEVAAALDECSAGLRLAYDADAAEIRGRSTRAS